MPFPGLHVETGSLIGSWPILPSSMSGVPVTLPRTIQSKATILGTLREPPAGYDVDGRSFYLSLDGGVPVSVGFSGGGPHTLSAVISRINTAMGTTVAFSDNGFLKLQSQTVGTGSLAISTNPSSTPTDCIKNLGLFPGITAYAGALTQTQNPDPDRQVATPYQMTVSEGESFEARVFNRAIAQLSINNDRNEGQLSKKRLAVRNTVDTGSYTKPGTVDGVQLSGGSLVYVGKATAPSVDALRKLFAVLDSEGRELVKETLNPYDIGHTYDFSTTTDGTNRQKVVSTAFAAGPGSLETGDYYLVCTGLTGGGAVFNNVPLKIIEVGNPGDNYAIIENIDPVTGQRVYVSQSGVSGTIVYRGIFPVVVDGVYENLTAAEAGTPRLENVQVSKRTGITPTRIELGNRIVCVGEDFTASVAIQVGDIVTWSGSAINTPFNNNGDYRVDRIIDKETLQVVASDWSAAILNPNTSGGAFGTIAIKTDGAFVLDPFLRFSANTGLYGVPATGDDVQVALLNGTTFRAATDADPAMFQGDLGFTQKADDTIEQAIVKMWGPSVKTVDDVLYTDYRINIESINSRLNWEHYNYDDAEKAGSGSADTSNWGRHKDIQPDTVNMWYWTPASRDTPRVILRGTGTRGHGADSNTSSDALLRVVNSSGQNLFTIDGDGRQHNKTTSSADVRIWQDFVFNGNYVEPNNLGGYNLADERIIWQGSHNWTGSANNPENVTLVGQQLITYLDLQTAVNSRFDAIYGQRVVVGASSNNTLCASGLTFVDLSGSLLKSVTDYGDNRDAVGTLYGLHIRYTLASNFKIFGDHYGIKVADITRAGTGAGGSGTNYAIYTGLGHVRFGDIVSVDAPSVATAQTSFYINSFTASGGNAYGLDTGTITSSASPGTAFGARIGAVHGSGTPGGACGIFINEVIGQALSTGIRVGTVSGYSASADCISVSVDTLSYAGTSNIGVRIGNVSGASASNIGLSIGNVSGTGARSIVTGTYTNNTATANFGAIETGAVSGSGDYSGIRGLMLGTVTATGTDSIAFGIDIGEVRGDDNAYGLFIRGLTGTSSSIKSAVYVEAISGSASNNYGVDVTGVSGASVSNVGVKIGTVSGAGAHSLLTGTVTDNTASSTWGAIATGAVSGSGNSSTISGILTGTVTASGTSSIAIGIDVGAVDGVASSYGIYVRSLVNSATGTKSGLAIAAISGSAASNYGIGLSGVSGGTENYGLYVYSVSGGTDSCGLKMGTVFGASSSNVGISTGTVTAAGSSAGYGILVGDVSSTSSSGNIANLCLGSTTSDLSAGDIRSLWTGAVTASGTNGNAIGIQVRAVSGTYASFGILIDSLTYASSSEKYGLFVSAISGNTTTNCGIHIGAVSGTGTNYALYTNSGQVYFGDGLVMGAATGGNKGAGTINVAGDIYKNNTAYTNPDYVFELAFTGKIERFRMNAGADDYRMLSLDEVESYTRTNLRLPRISNRAAGLFSMADLALEKIEELYLHLFEKNRQIKRLEEKLEALTARLSMSLI